VVVVIDDLTGVGRSACGGSRPPDTATLTPWRLLGTAGLGSRRRVRSSRGGGWGVGTVDGGNVGRNCLWLGSRVPSCGWFGSTGDRGGGSVAVGSRSRDLVVGEGLIDVDLNTGVASRVCTRELDGRRFRTSVATDVQLVAARVELGTSSAPSGVKSDLFSAKEVVPGSNIGNGERVVTAVSVEKVVSPPLRVASDQASLVNLEPVGRRSDGGLGVRDSSQVDGDRSVVGATDGLIRARTITVLVHLNSDLVAGFHVAKVLCVGVSIASNVRRGNAGDGAVASSSSVAGSARIDAINPELLPSGVSSRRGSEEEERCGGGSFHGG